MGARSIIFTQEELKEVDAALSKEQNTIVHMMLYSESPRTDYPQLHDRHKTLREIRSKIGRELDD